MSVAKASDGDLSIPEDAVVELCDDGHVLVFLVDGSGKRFRFELTEDGQAWIVEHAPAAKIA